MLCKDVAEDIQSCKEHIQYAALSLKEKLSALKNIMVGNLIILTNHNTNQSLLKPLVLVTAILRIGFLSLAIYNITAKVLTNQKQALQVSYHY